MYLCYVLAWGIMIFGRPCLMTFLLAFYKYLLYFTLCDATFFVLATIISDRWVRGYMVETKFWDYNVPLLPPTYYKT